MVLARQSNVGNVISVATNNGTAFPSGPSINDQFYRTDLHLVFFWDGTDWLTVNEYSADWLPAGAVGPTYSANGTILIARIGMTNSLTTWKATRFDASNSVGGPSSAVVYWNGSVYTTDDPTLVDLPVTSFNTQDQTPGDWINVVAELNSLTYSGLSYCDRFLVVCSIAKVGAPGTLTIYPYLAYRLRGT
jgi:hypothetical protein